MNPPENQPGLQLPAPMPEQHPGAQNDSPEHAPSAVEQAPAGPETGQQPGAQMPAALPTIPLPAAPTAIQPAVSPTTQSSTPATADDGDLIEKEWVEKAKKIVEANRDDPHAQSEELTVVKADYLQKRYNKTIKVSQ